MYFQPFVAVGRGSETQQQMVEKLNKTTNMNLTIAASGCQRVSESILIYTRCTRHTA